MITMLGKNGWFDYNHFSIKKMELVGAEQLSLRLWSRRSATQPPIRIDGSRTNLISLLQTIIKELEKS